MAGQPLRRQYLANLNSLSTAEQATTMHRVCELIAAKSSLAKVAATLAIPRGALCDWIDSNEQRKTALEVARARAADLLVHEGLKIADSGPENGQDVHRDRLRWQVRQFLAASWDKKLYALQPNNTTINVDARSLHIDALRKPVAIALETANSRTVDSNTAEKKELPAGPDQSRTSPEK